MAPSVTDLPPVSAASALVGRVTSCFQNLASTICSCEAYASGYQRSGGANAMCRIPSLMSGTIAHDRAANARHPPKHR